TAFSSEPICPCALVNRTAAHSSSRIFALKIIATHAAIASRLCNAALINFRAAIAKRRERFAFWFWPDLARFMQETERSVSYPREINDDRGRSKNGAYRLPGADRQRWARTAHRQRHGQS